MIDLKVIESLMVLTYGLIYNTEGGANFYSINIPGTQFAI
jgi:hypothetical protein